MDPNKNTISSSHKYDIENSGIIYLQNIWITFKLVKVMLWYDRILESNKKNLNLVFKKYYWCKEMLQVKKYIK